MVDQKIKSAIGIILIVAGFIVASYIVQNNLDFFKNYIGHGFLGMITYTLIVVVSIVLAPINEVILMPVATALWGWFITALLTLLGLTLGSIIVFVLTRKYGAPLIRKLLPLDKIYKYERLMPQEHLFVGIILLRIAVPIDVVSYAIGLFTKIRFVPYFFATLIGFLPLAFFLAYIGTLPAHMQIIGFIVFLFVVIIGYLSVRHKNTKKQEALVKKYGSICNL